MMLVLNKFLRINQGATGRGALSLICLMLDELGERLPKRRLILVGKQEKSVRHLQRETAFQKRVF